jgi:hypothetical protein
MRINTAVGEVGLTVGGREYRLRPSFLSMSAIGESGDLISTAGWINSAKLKLNYEPEKISVLDMSTAIFIIQCCCDEEIPELGCIIGSDWTGKLFYKEGAVNGHDLIVIADHLISYGVNGVETTRSKIAARFSSKKDDFIFKVTEFVASAIAHLKLSAKDAWDLTMPEFQLAMDSLYPPDEKKANIPTQEQAEETYQKVLAARERHNKNKKA